MTVSEYLAEIDAVNRGGVYQPEWESLCTHPTADCPENPAKAAALADDGSYCKSSIKQDYNKNVPPSDEQSTRQ